MNLFRRKQEQEPVMICIEESPLATALAAVQAADNRISELSEEFRALQEKYSLSIDRDGQILRAVVPDLAMRAELDRQVRENRRATDRALRDFHVALSAWAGLKGESHASNC